MRRSLSLLISMMLFACSTPINKSSRASVAVQRTTDTAGLAETISTQETFPITASVRFAAYDARNPRQTRITRWIGMDGGTPEYVVSQFTLSVGGMSVAIPPSLYEDFSDLAFFPPYLSIERVGRHLHLIHSGSDGAGSFTARFVVRHHRLEELRISKQGVIGHAMAGQVEIIRKPPL